MPVLYIVATPIGNLEDITLRALRVLKEVGLIAAEDTRRTRHLLSAYGIRTPITSYHEYSNKAKLSHLINQLKEKDIALVSEAGMPGLSDPGYELIVAAAQLDIQIVPIPGPSVAITSLVISGLPIRQFTYLGFLPQKKKERKQLLESVSGETRTMIIFESPHHLLATLIDLNQVFGDRRIAVTRELTKIHEEIFRGRISEAIEHFTEPRGEFTLVIEGNIESEKPVLTPAVAEEIRRLYNQGINAKRSASQLSAATGLSKRELYQAWLEIKNSHNGPVSNIE